MQIVNNVGIKFKARDHHIVNQLNTFIALIYNTYTVFGSAGASQLQGPGLNPKIRLYSV